MNAPGQLFQVLGLLDSIANILFRVKSGTSSTSIILRVCRFAQFKEAFLVLGKFKATPSRMKDRVGYAVTARVLGVPNAWW